MLKNKEGAKLQKNPSLANRGIMIKHANSMMLRGFALNQKFKKILLRNDLKF